MTIINTIDSSSLLHAIFTHTAQQSGHHFRSGIIHIGLTRLFVPPASTTEDFSPFMAPELGELGASDYNLQSCRASGVQSLMCTIG